MSLKVPLIAIYRIARYIAMDIRSIVVESVNYVLKEDVTWSKNDDGGIDMSIGHSTTDKDNVGNNKVDTRVFGTKNDVLNGDGTNNHAVSINDKSQNRNDLITLMRDTITWIETGRKGSFDLNKYNIPLRSRGAWVKNIQEQGLSDNDAIAWCNKNIQRVEMEANIMNSKISRLSDKKANDKVMRYNIGLVPGTNVRFISMFYMQDFNFSDALKHGTARQNGNTDAILGRNLSDRESKGHESNKIDVTYDGGHKPNIAQNFSLNGVQDGHYKQQYSYNDDSYTSVNQFLDKSVMYAANILKEQGYHPDVIIACASSSKFNDYFCTNLSNKLGVPYVREFFKRNVVNVKFDDERDEQDMKRNGCTDAEIDDFKHSVKLFAYREIFYLSTQPLSKFLRANEQYFGNISSKPNSRDKVPFHRIERYLVSNALGNIAANTEGNDAKLTKSVIRTFDSTTNQDFLGVSKKDTEHVQKQINATITQHGLTKAYYEAIFETEKAMKPFIQQLMEQGYRLALNTPAKQFKITDFDQRFRPYLHKVYVIADGLLNKDNELESRYRNAKYLIYDEDINSGTTLKLTIDAINENIPEHNDNDILCLVNAYSPGGK